MNNHLISQVLEQLSNISKWSSCQTFYLYDVTLACSLFWVFLNSLSQSLFMVILNNYQYGQVLGPGFYHTAQVVLDSYRIIIAK